MRTRRPSSMLRRGGAWAAVAALGLLSAAAAAQEPPAQPSEPFFETVHVNVVNVQVFVTDKAGRPVTGLTRDDFLVLEDGEPVEITNFFGVEERRRVEHAAPDAEPSEDERAVAEPAESPVPAAQPLPDDQRLYVVIFVDNVNIRPANRRWVMGALRRFVVDQLTSEDRVMLVSYDRDPHVRQAFTGEPQKVIEALDVIARVTAGAVATDADRRRALLDIHGTNNVNSAISAARFYAAYIHNQTRLALAAMKDLVRDLSGIPGRKALLHVSDGIPLTAGEDVFTALEEKFGIQAGRRQAVDFDLTRDYQELVNQANAADVTLYALDAKGLQGDSSLTADEMGTLNLRGARMIDSVRFSNLAAPLQIMAESTGGQAIFNTNAVDAALDRVGEDFSSYYSLGYRAPGSGDGRFHRIEVKLRDGPDGARVRHRAGYRDKRPEVIFQEGSVAALRYGITQNPLGIEVEMGRPQRRDDGRFLVPLEIRIPLAAIALAPAGSDHFGRVRVATGVMDERGDISPMQSQEPRTIRVPGERLAEAQEKHWTYEFQLLMDGGRSKIAVGVHDELGASSSYLFLPVDLAG